MAKKVSGNNETVNDILLSYTLDGTTTTTTVGVAVSSLPSAPTMSVPYFQQPDDNGVVDACAVIPTGNTCTFLFQRTDLSTYTKPSNDFVGGRPIER